MDDAGVTLLKSLRSFLLPGGLEAVQQVSCVRLKQQGEMRSAPGARWVPFTAEERIDARRSGFVWEARFRTARVVPMLVVDAYEEGRGRLVVKVGGALPVVNARGAEYDRGELQRYLSYVALCPAMLAANDKLVWIAAGGQVLRVSDVGDRTGAAVDYDIGQDGRPVRSRAERPRTVGKQAVLTPWSAAGLDFVEREGMRVASRLEAAWEFPDGPFIYFRSEITSYALER